MAEVEPSPPQTSGHGAQRPRDLVRPTAWREGRDGPSPVVPLPSPAFRTLGVPRGTAKDPVTIVMRCPLGTKLCAGRRAGILAGVKAFPCLAKASLLQQMDTCIFCWIFTDL